MSQSTEFMDVADSDFLSHKEIDDDDSEFDFEFEKYFVFSSAKKRIFGRKRPLYVLLGAGKIANIILWRKKKISASTLVGVTFIWFLFKRMDYTLLSFICDSLLLLLAILFLWAILSSFTKLSPPKSSAFILPEGLLVNTVSSVAHELNKLLITFGILASGHDLKTFIMVTMTLVSVSVISTCYTAATLFYLASVTLLIGPAVYERNEDIVDIIVEKAKIELNNLFAQLMKKIFGNSHYLQDSILE